MAKMATGNRSTGRKDDKNVNRAITLTLVGFVAEIYLLILERYFARGTVGQLLAANSYLRVMVYVSPVLLAAGAVYCLLRRKSNPRGARWGRWAAEAGAFLFLSSLLMRKIYPEGTTALCILVPVLTVLGIIYLLYQREFAVEITAIALSIGALVLMDLGAGSGTWHTAVRVCAGGALLLLALAVAGIAAARKNGGALGRLRVFSGAVEYRLLYAVLALCFAAVLLALLVSGAAYYGAWALAAVALALAVFYTIRLL